MVNVTSFSHSIIIDNTFILYQSETVTLIVIKKKWKFLCYSTTYWKEKYAYLLVYTDSSSDFL